MGIGAVLLSASNVIAYMKDLERYERALRRHNEWELADEIRVRRTRLGELARIADENGTTIPA